MKILWNKKFQILFFLLFIWLIFYGIYEIESLEKRKKITIGKITGTKNSKGTLITYSYKIDSVSYRKKYRIGYSDFEGTSRSDPFSYNDVHKYLLNKKFPVIYDSLDFFNSDILILEKDFIRYKLPYPDSLNWTKDILKTK